MNIPVAVYTQENVNELDLCDDEIRALFEGKTYMLGMALNAQLIKELRELNRHLTKLAGDKGGRIAAHGVKDAG